MATESGVDHCASKQACCRDLGDRCDGVQSFVVRRIIDDRVNVRRRERQSINHVQQQIKKQHAPCPEQDRPRQQTLWVPDFTGHIRSRVPADIRIRDIHHRTHHGDRQIARERRPIDQVGCIRPADGQAGQNDNSENRQFKRGYPALDVGSPFAPRDVDEGKSQNRDGGQGAFPENGLRARGANGLTTYFAAANAADALGAENPIRNDTQPDKNAGSGP